VRKDKFKAYPAVHPELDLVEADDQITFDNMDLDTKVCVVVYGCLLNHFVERHSSVYFPNLSAWISKYFKI
jgi:hypothetical protein